MNILYFIGAYGPRYLANDIHRELLLEYSRRGHRCIVFAGVTPGELAGDDADFWDGPIEVRRHICRNDGLNKLVWEFGRRVWHYPRWLTLLRGYRRVLQQYQSIDVVHADSVYPMGAIAAIATPHQVPIVPTINGGDLIDYPGYGYGRFAVPRGYLRYTWRRSAIVRSNSLLMMERAHDLGCPRDKLRHIPVNIDGRFFDYGVDWQQRRRVSRQAVAARHGFDPAGPLMLSVGRLLPLKGFADAIEAFKPVVHEHPNAHLIVAGPDALDARSGDQRLLLQTLIDRLGLQDHVLLMPRLDHEEAMSRYLAAADVLLAIAHIEGMNRVVPEAGSLGTPSIVTRTTGVAPLVAHLGAGLVVPPHDPGAVTQAMKLVLGDRARWQQLSSGSRRLAQHFRTEVIADRLLELYATAAERL